MHQVALYRHRQIGWAILISAVIPLALIYLSSHLGGNSAAPLRSFRTMVSANPLLLIGPLVLVLVLLVFSSLEVSVDRTSVRLRFGPGGLIRKSWPVASIAQAVATRTDLRQGWGIHRRGGITLYNVSGFNAVRLSFKDGSVALVGSNDAARLSSTINRLVEH